METKNGSNYLLEVDTVSAITLARPASGVNYKLIACQVSTGFSAQTAAQTTTNKCGNGYQASQPGEKSWSFNIEGQVVTLAVGEVASMVNSKSLKQLWKDGDTAFFRFTDAADDEDLYDEGKAWVSAYEETAPTNDVVTFTATLTGTGEPFFDPLP